MIVGAGGAEERHTSNATATGLWASPVYIEIHTVKKYTGAACYYFKQLATGNAPQSANQASGWWSWANWFSGFNDGTYRLIFKLCNDDGGRFIGWSKGTQTYESKLTMWKGPSAGTVLVDSGATQFTAAMWHRVKLEFAAGHWTAWASDDGAAWTQVFTYNDSGNFTTMGVMHMSLNASTDETKGEAYGQQYADDCIYWDDDGDNWNSRIPADDFPRISLAHMPNTVGAKDESDAGQAALIDDMPPTHAADGTDKSTIDETDYWTDVDDLDETGTTENPDLTVETIQALMVTHVAGTFGAEDTELNKYNYSPDQGTTVYTDVEEGGRVIQVGAELSGSPVNWWTHAGYFPWTPETTSRSWTEAIFEASQYGISLINTKTDQMTVQVIFFGSSHEWSPPAGEIEWLSGIIAAQSGLSGVLIRDRSLSGSIGSVSVLTGLLVRDRPLSGLIDSQSGLSGSLGRLRSLSGSIDAVSALVGALEVLRELQGVIAGQSQLTGNITRDRKLAGSIDGQSSMSATLNVLIALQGTIDGQSGLSATLNALLALQGAIDGQSSLDGTLSMVYGLGGTIEAVSTISGNLVVLFSLSGTIACVCVIDGNLTIIHPSPLRLDAAARAIPHPLFGDAWQQPKEPPDG